MRSISSKLTFALIVFSVLNIAVFTIYIYENQMDLIVENVKLLSREKANQVRSRIDAAVDELNRDPVRYGTEAAILGAIDDAAAPLLGSYAVFRAEAGRLRPLKESGGPFASGEDEARRAELALANREFLGKPFDSRMDEGAGEIVFYFALGIERMDDAVLVFKLDKLRPMKERLRVLYLMVGFAIGAIALFHLCFGLAVNAMIVSPVKRLSAKSLEFSAGDLDARVGLKRKDEIGRLGADFDRMAESIQEKIVELDERNERMLVELRMAKKVQGSIYPEPRGSKAFDVAVYHRPLIEVSGDYHDILDLGGGRRGILVADVSGHGVAAALVTMLIKNQVERNAPRFDDPKDFMRFMNADFRNLMDDYGSYFTAFYAVIAEDGGVAFVNASHPRPFYWKAATGELLDLDAGGFIIGMDVEVDGQFLSGKLAAEAGDKIVLYTDGITESTNAERTAYGEDRLAAAIRANAALPCRESLDGIAGDFHAFLGDAKRRDDETLMVIEFAKGAGNA